jgi:hypothetical protein
MFSLDRLRPFRIPTRLDESLSRFSPLLLTGLVLFAMIHGVMLIQLSNGGSDLVDADIPKSLMILQGQNPYSTEPWASPYPPLLLLVDSGIIRLTSLLTSQYSIDSISQNIRLTGLLFDALVATIIYQYLRSRTSNPLSPLISAGLFLTLPALSISPLYFFHSDTFGYPILALSILALASHRYLIGTTLLATATIFKIHPILALPLVLVWIARTKTLRTALTSTITSLAILGLGLLLPLTIPGYADSILGFNLSNNGNGTTLTSVLSLANSILPDQLRGNTTTLYVDQVWIAATLALYTIVLGTVWIKSRRLEPVDIILLGLLAWLVPLKVEYTHYVVWAMIPLLMRGRLKQTIPALALLQLADTMSYWAWWPSTSPIPGMNTLYGLIATSAIYRTLGIAALCFTVFSNGGRIRPLCPLEEGLLGAKPQQELEPTLEPSLTV